MVHAKLRQQIFWWPFRKNGIIKTMAVEPHNLYLSFKLTSLYFGSRPIQCHIFVGCGVTLKSSWVVFCNTAKTLADWVWHSPLLRRSCKLMCKLGLFKYYRIRVLSARKEIGALNKRALVLIIFSCIYNMIIKWIFVVVTTGLPIGWPKLDQWHLTTARGSLWFYVRWSQFETWLH